MLARAPGEAMAPVTAAPDAGASDLVRAGTQALRQGDLAGAKKLLQRAQKLNDEEPGLWSGFGLLESLNMHYDAGMADYRKELQLHPTAYAAYSMLVALEETAGKRGEQEATLAEWSRAQPEQIRPPLELMEMLVADGKPADAAAVGRAAETRLQSANAQAPGFQLELGKCEVAVPEDREAGRKRLTALLADDATPGTLNDAAYELADANLDLPLAESSVHHALAALEETERKWTLDNLTGEEAGEVRLQAAAWDTLGWTLYREGKAEAGLGWVQAAWVNRKSSIEGEHLGDLYVATGHPEKAGAYYIAAKDMASKKFDPARVRLEGKLAALKKPERMAIQ